jgi:hypothetical protein
MAREVVVLSDVLPVDGWQPLGHFARRAHGPNGCAVGDQLLIIQRT